MHYLCEGGIESLKVTMGDPRDRFFYPTLTLMIDSYIIYWAVHEILVLVSSARR